MAPPTPDQPLREPLSELLSESSGKSLAPAYPYLVGLNTLRAIAALLVCVRHFAYLLPEREQVAALREILGYLPSGAQLFFVVSGYIVPYSLLRQQYRLPRYGAFLRRRFVRVAPPFYIAALLTVLNQVVVSRLLPAGTSVILLPSLAKVIHNLLFTVPYTTQEWIIGAAWTLGVEWQFYLLIGLLLPLLFAARWGGWLSLALYATVGLLTWQLLPSGGLSLLTFSPLFALGTTTLLWQRGQLPLLPYLAGLLSFGLLEAALLNPLAAAASVLLVLALLFLRKPVPGLDTVGRIAYSLTLTHMLTGRTVEYVLYRRAPGARQCRGPETGRSNTCSTGC